MSASVPPKNRSVLQILHLDYVPETYWPEMYYLYVQRNTLRNFYITIMFYLVTLNALYNNKRHKIDYTIHGISEF